MLSEDDVTERKDAKDLKLSSSILFQTVKTKRVLVQNAKSNTNGIPVIKRDLCVHITPYLTLDLWKRHKYTYDDIEITLRSFQPVHLWGISMALGLAPTRATVQPSYDTDDTLIYGAKSPAVKQIMQCVRDSLYPDNPYTESVLTRRVSRHKPVLPVHKVKDVSLFKQYLKHQLVNNSQRLFQWEDIVVVPIQLEADKYLLMTRVIDEASYAENIPSTKVPGLQPTLIRVGEQNYARLEESFFLVCDQSLIV